jgi:transcriptional regulator with PAS, ATPase and Fis domain
VLCRGRLIEMAHLPPHLRGSQIEGGGAASSGRTLAALEAMHIRDALKRHQENRAAAARELGIASSTLFRKLKTLRIKSPTT